MSPTQSDATKKNEQHSARGKYMPPDRMWKQNKQIAWEKFPRKMRKNAQSIMRKTCWLMLILIMKPFQCTGQQWNEKHLKVPLLNRIHYLKHQASKLWHMVWSISSICWRVFLDLMLVFRKICRRKSLTVYQSKKFHLDKTERKYQRRGYDTTNKEKYMCTSRSFFNRCL